MTRMITVRATRTFQAHSAGDVLLVEETPDVKLLVKSRLFEVIAVESEGGAVDEPREQQGPTLAPGETGTLTAPKPKAKPKAKPARDNKTGQVKKAAKNV